MSDTKTFTEGPILGPLVKFTLPILFALFLQSMYGAVDLLVVGKFATSADVSAVSTGSQIMMTMTNVITAFAMGLTIYIGQKIGEGRPQEAGKGVSAGIFFFGVLAVCMTLIMIIFAVPFAGIMQAPPEAFDQTVSYVRICGGGSMVILAYNLIGSIFRGLGDSHTPLITVAIACVCNIFGDLLLCAVFHMGTAGAAWATVAAQLISVILSFVLIRRKTMPFQVEKKEIRWNGAINKTIVHLGFPLALSNFLVGVSFLVIIAIVNSLGLIASAGVGVGEKVCGFLMLIPLSFLQALAAFIAQNIGAGKTDRARKTLRYGLILSMISGITMFLVTWFHGNILASIFSNDPQVITAATEYLKAYAIDCVCTAVLFCMIGFFNGIGMTRFVMFQDIFGAFCIRIPIAYFMSRKVPVSLFHLGVSTPCSSLIQNIMCIIMFIHVKKKVLPRLSKDSTVSTS